MNKNGKYSGFKGEIVALGVVGGAIFATGLDTSEVVLVRLDDVFTKSLMKKIRSVGLNSFFWEKTARFLHRSR